MRDREFDRKAFGPVVMEYLARKVDTGIKQRELISADRVLDIQFNDFIQDGVGTVQKIYQHFNLAWTDEVAKRFKAYDEAHPMNKHGKHDYRLEEYGLTREQILERFAGYIERFEVPIQ